MTGPGNATVFRNRRGALAAYLVLGAFLVVYGVGTGVFLVAMDDAETAIRAVGVGLAVFVVWLGYWFGSQSLRRLMDANPPIVVGPDGLHDRAVSRRPIAWGEIRDLHLWRGGRGAAIVVFDLAEGAAERAGVRRTVKATASINRLFGYGYHVHALGTDATAERLVNAIAPYAEVAGAA